MDMTDAPKLLPCPFCGGAAVLDPGEITRAECGGDECPMDECYTELLPRDEAIAAWNRRASVPAPATAADWEMVAELADVAADLTVGAIEEAECGRYGNMARRREAVRRIDSVIRSGDLAAMRAALEELRKWT